MKNEYIAGDLVITKTEPNNFIQSGIICKFKGYDLSRRRNMVLLDVINAPDIFSLCENQIVPIPLTHEILEKNGWEHKDDIYIKEFPHRKLVVMDKNVYVINESCSMFLCPAEFVPQIQHLLFGLGLNSEMEV